MGLLKLFGMAANNYATVRTLQTGADRLILSFGVEALAFPKQVRAQADEMIKFLYFRGDMEKMTEAEAALLKSAFFLSWAEQSDRQQLKAMIADSMRALRKRHGDQIGPDVSLKVMSETGL